MDAWMRDLHVNRLLSGYTRCRINGEAYLIGGVSREHRYIAQEIYVDTYKEAILEDILTEAEAFELMKEAKVWTPKDEDEYQKLIKLIDDFKVGLFEKNSESNARFAIRQQLERGKEELERMERVRHTWDYITCEGIAASARMRFLTGCSLHHTNKMPYWTNPEEDWYQPDVLLDDVMEYVLTNRLDESAIRDIARNDPWRSLWSIRNNVGKGLIDSCSIDILDELRPIITWSSVYDSIREHPDAPDDSIVDDDDMLDGWMIIQRRKRENEMIKKKGEESLSKNEKIRNAAEVFLVQTDDRTADDVVKIANAMTDDIGKSIKAQRMNFLKQKGEVSEAHMPDTSQHIRMELAKMESQRIRGK